MPQPESHILAEVRLALGREPDITLWRNDCGVAKHGSRTVRYGLSPGSADLIGILAPAGRLFALEVKTPSGRLSDKQQLFIELVRRRGGFAAVVHSAAEARAALYRARNGEHA